MKLRYIILLWIIISFVALVVKEVEYQTIKHRFPNMSRWEYFIIENKIRIYSDEKENE